MSDITVGVLLAEGFEQVEALTPVDFLRRAGITVTTISTTSDLCVTSSHAVKVQADTKLTDVENTQFSLVVIPGGLPGSVNLGEDARVIEFLKRHKDQGAILAAICAAPYYVLALHGFLENTKYTCNPGFHAKAKEALSADPSSDRVVVDGKIITSQAAGTSGDFSHAIISMLVGKQKADEVMRGSLYQV